MRGSEDVAGGVVDDDVAAELLRLGKDFGADAGRGPHPRLRAIRRDHDARLDRLAGRIDRESRLVHIEPQVAEARGT